MINGTEPANSTTSRQSVASLVNSFTPNRKKTHEEDKIDVSASANKEEAQPEDINATTSMKKLRPRAK